MAFRNYKDIGEVLQEFQIYYSEANFMGETEFSIPSYFLEDLEIVMEDGLPDDSEFTICENLIYPVIKEVWKHYRTKFVLWSHKYLTDCENHDRFPEYILAKRSRLGKVVFDRPYLVLVDAKQDRFHEGWVQCLLEMIVAQQLDNQTNKTIFGIVSHGRVWQFGKLELDRFIYNGKPYTIQEIDKLFAAVNYVFQQCEIQLNELVGV
ncbi:MAG: hypothetical protein LDL41_06100 [Coleofasciculus sp. S288]|nr:hypothetical protein [Coleofasciculus sp. S288]